MRLLRKIVDVKPNELRALWLSFLFFFVVLAGYYVIRPIRDNIGANSFENLWWMFTVVLVVMIGANALFSAIVARMPRRKFIPIAYRFFIANLIIFFRADALRAARQTALGRWMLFRLGQRLQSFRHHGLLGLHDRPVHRRTGQAALWIYRSRRLARGNPRSDYHRIAGSSRQRRRIVVDLRGHAGSRGANACVSSPPNSKREDRHDAPVNSEKPIGGGIWEGISHIYRSPYLFGLFLFILLYTFTSTWAYFQQAELTKVGFADRAARTAFFANLDLCGEFHHPVAADLSYRPIDEISRRDCHASVHAGAKPVRLCRDGLVPVLTVLAVFQVTRRASTFAFMRPAREVLFTVLRREDKYKAKSFIDTFGYRCGDQFGAWSYKGLQELGLGLSAISFIAVPIVAVWCALGVWLGRKQATLAAAPQPETK